MPATPSDRAARGIVLCLAVAAYAHFAGAVSAYDPNVFDGALFLLQSIYPTRGVVPYGDFGFVYAPGVAMLFGDLLGLSQPPRITAAA